jgi:hypothetical protein
MPRPHPGESQDKFIARCMASAESRRSFPDEAQRAAVCHSVWRRRAVHKTACCALCAKADIPEVQAVIRLLDPFVQRELKEIAAAVYRELLARLDAFSEDLGAPDVDALVQAGEDRDDVLAAILAALLAVVEQGYGAFVSGDFRERVEDAVDELFAFGAGVVGFPFEGARMELLRQAAVAQLDLMLRETVTGQSVRLQGMLEDFLTTAGLRSVAAATLSAAAGDDGGSREAFQTELASALAPEAAAASAVDAWAYLWAGLSGVEAALAGGIRAFQAIAVIDGNTTAFCRWVNGRIIPLSRVRPQIDAITKASLGGQMDALKRAWPFLDSEVARRGNELQFELFFRKAGLPPYHFGCRTQPRPIMIGR